MGWMCLFVVLVTPVLLWFFKGEAFLAATEKQAADVLVVEGWIAGPGIRAAASEFRSGGYQYIVTTGGLTSSRWGQQRWGYAEAAEHVLLKAGVPPNRIVLAPASDVNAQRTFASAVAVARVLKAKDLRPRAINVFSLGVHGRRTALVFQKVLGSQTKVGMIAWRPQEQYTGPWWRSSERAEAFITESAGYLFELLLNSGRGNNAVQELPVNENY
jgi:hypothetical protein